MHMSNRSAMMMGGKMDYMFDDAQGRAVGSKITMTGSFAGMGLTVEEVVTVREPPWRKIWETAGTPSLLILTWYRMGFTIKPNASGSELTVALDYRRPCSLLAGLLAWLAAPLYARWCVSRMANDARRKFETTAPATRQQEL